MSLRSVFDLTATLKGCGIAEPLVSKAILTVCFLFERSKAA